MLHYFLDIIAPKTGEILLVKLSQLRQILNLTLIIQLLLYSNKKSGPKASYGHFLIKNCLKK